MHCFDMAPQRQEFQLCARAAGGLSASTSLGEDVYILQLPHFEEILGGDLITTQGDRSSALMYTSESCLAA